MAVFAQGDKAEINRVALTHADRFEPMPGGTLEALRALLAESRIALPEELPPPDQLLAELAAAIGIEGAGHVWTDAPELEGAIVVERA